MAGRPGRCRPEVASRPGPGRRGPLAGRLDDLTFHDLRHTGQTLAAQTGATLADLMKRLGHSSMAAARRYLHAVDGRDREIAKALSELAAHGDVARLRRHITMRG
ncbi:tyrosine-type recombinase/integrase [Micromonospora kangleipakensis]|uniref:tyrosine-type recombinase/integrase n=1 Tax=Micromonospora kangleipakensis TaxID=1077942 RepID=UPI001028D997|nr:tyrosine-type recombinase/integrase [Micromonospora kangleipakensis]